jgi:hypothetical protein
MRRSEPRLSFWHFRNAPEIGVYGSAAPILGPSRGRFIICCPKRWFAKCLAQGLRNCLAHELHVLSFACVIICRKLAGATSLIIIANLNNSCTTSAYHIFCRGVRIHVGLNSKHARVAPWLWLNCWASSNHCVVHLVIECAQSTVYARPHS